MKNLTSVFKIRARDTSLFLKEEGVSSVNQRSTKFLQEMPTLKKAKQVLLARDNGCASKGCKADYKFYFVKPSCC